MKTFQGGRNARKTVKLQGELIQLATDDFDLDSTPWPNAATIRKMDTARRAVMAAAWGTKFPQSVVQQKICQQPIDYFSEQAKKAREGNVRYVLGRKQTARQSFSDSPYAGEMPLNGIARVELIDPRNPVRLRYPSITDLEVADGRQRSPLGAMLLAECLEGFHDRSRVGFYSEAVNLEGNEWLEAIGLEKTGNQPTETLSDGTTITYIHLEGKVGDVRDSIVHEFPMLYAQVLPVK